MAKKKKKSSSVHIFPSLLLGEELSINCTCISVNNMNRIDISQTFDGDPLPALIIALLLSNRKEAKTLGFGFLTVVEVFDGYSKNKIRFDNMTFREKFYVKSNNYHYKNLNYFVNCKAIFIKKTEHAKTYLSVIYVIY